MRRIDDRRTRRITAPKDRKRALERSPANPMANKVGEQVNEQQPRLTTENN